MLNFCRLLLVAIALTACTTPVPNKQFQPKSTFETGVFIHRPSGANFPEEIGNFKRDRITRYDENGYDIGVDYNLKTIDKAIVATVFVYPSQPIKSFGSPLNVIYGARTFLCKQEFDRRREELVSAHSGAKSLDVKITEESKQNPQFSELFKYYQETYGLSYPLLSLLDLSCYHNEAWTIKFRVTYPENLSVEQELSAIKNAIKFNDQ